jgi:hypothetical protein
MMPSFFTNNRMPPALRARVLASLGSDARSRAGGGSAVTGSRLTRLLVAVGVAALATTLFFTYRKSRADFETEKNALVLEYERQTRPFDDEFLQRVDRVDQFLKTAHEEYQGDHIAPFFRGERARLEEILQRPMVFIRGPLRGFRSISERRSTWEEGGPDAFIRCLILPPSDIEEKTLLRHLGEIYQPRAFAGRFVNLDAAFRAQAVVRSSFASDLQSAAYLREVQTLSRKLRGERLHEGVSFASVDTLGYLLDEPKAAGTPSDFDGEATHFVRLGIVDLRSGVTLLRFRRQVSPEWISEKSRLMYSRQLDSCRLAFEVRRELDQPELNEPELNEPELNEPEPNEPELNEPELNIP